MKTKTKRPKQAHPKHKQPKYPRFMSYVRLSDEVKDLDEAYGYTNTLGPGPYIFFGEIPNMPGHCVVMNQIKNFTVGMHTENFVELTDEET